MSALSGVEALQVSCQDKRVFALSVSNSVISSLLTLCILPWVAKQAEASTLAFFLQDMLCLFFWRTAYFFRESFVFLGSAAESVCAKHTLLLLRSKILWGGCYKALDLEDSSGQRGKENFKTVPKYEAEI